MNAHFLPIKVDREERPDLDSIYMQALQMIAGQGGWLNIFLTPMIWCRFTWHLLSLRITLRTSSFLQLLQALRYYDTKTGFAIA